MGKSIEARMPWAMSVAVVKVVRRRVWRGGREGQIRERRCVAREIQGGGDGEGCSMALVRRRAWAAWRARVWAWRGRRPNPPALGGPARVAGERGRWCVPWMWLNICWQMVAWMGGMLCERWRNSAKFSTPFSPSLLPGGQATSRGNVFPTPPHPFFVPSIGAIICSALIQLSS